MKIAVVVSCDIEKVEDLVPLIEHMDPPHIPFFAGEVRIVPPDHYDEVINFLMEGESNAISERQAAQVPPHKSS